MCVLSNGTPARRIWQTIKVNITLGHITQRYILTTYMIKNFPWYYP
jgi:hypothetical protein